MKILLSLLLSFNVMAVEYADVEKALKSHDDLKALKLLNQLDSKSQGYKKIDYTKAIIAFRNNKLDDAEDYIEAAIKNYPHAEVYSLAGSVYGMQAANSSVFSKLSYAKKSKKYLQLAYDEEPGNKDYIEGLIQFNIQAPSIAGGDRNAIQPLLKELEKIDKTSAIQLRTQFLLDEEGEETALAYIYSQMHQDQSNMRLKYASATLLSSMDKYDKAAKQFLDVIASEKAIDENKMVRINSLYQLGRLASMQKKWLDQGEQAYLEFLAIEDTSGAPPKSWANYRLGLIYQHQNKKSLAQTQFKKAMSMNPDKKLKKHLKKVITK